jgi:integrase/recombinase XerD
MVLRVEHGKGGIDRDIPLSPKLLETLREYWRWMRPKTYLFPGTEHNWRTDKPITSKVIWLAVHEAALKAGIDKRVTSHTLRHYSGLWTMPGARAERCQGKSLINTHFVAPPSLRPA